MQNYDPELGQVDEPETYCDTRKEVLKNMMGTCHNDIGAILKGLLLTKSGTT